MKYFIIGSLLFTSVAFAFNTKSSFKGELRVRTTNEHQEIVSEFICQNSESDLILTENYFSFVAVPGTCQNVLGGDIGFTQEWGVHIFSYVGLQQELTKDGVAVGKASKGSIVYDESDLKTHQFLNIQSPRSDRFTFEYFNEKADGYKQTIVGKFRRVKAGQN